MVENIRRNIMVHGGGGGGGDGGAPVSLGKEEGRKRDMAAREVEKLRNILRRQRKDLKAKMLEVSREEAEWKRMLDKRSTYKHKQVMLEAYDQQCDEVAKIFAEYHKRLRFYVVKLGMLKGQVYSGNREKEAIYSTLKGSKSVEDVILIETTRERNIRKACESLSPPLLLQAITTHTSRLKSLISREIEKIDVKNNRVIDVSSPDVSSPLHYQLYGNGKMGIDVPSKGSQNQLLERQKAHVQQFFATEDALNKATEARNVSEKLIKCLQGSGNVTPTSLAVGGTSQNVGSLRQFENQFIAVGDDYLIKIWDIDNVNLVNTLDAEGRCNKVIANRLSFPIVPFCLKRLLHNPLLILLTSWMRYCKFSALIYVYPLIDNFLRNTLCWHILILLCFMSFF
ncbi:hypothetical protein UlMin_012053 [Ulmus minor]